jgi:hypothetical protein
MTGGPEFRRLPPGIPGSCLAGDAGHPDTLIISPLVYDGEGHASFSTLKGTQR